MMSLFLALVEGPCPPTVTAVHLPPVALRGEHRLRSVHLQAGGRGGRVRDLSLRTSSLGLGPAEWDLTLQSSQVVFRRKVIWVSCHPSISVLFTSFQDSPATFAFFALEVGRRRRVPTRQMAASARPSLHTAASEGPSTPRGNHRPLDFPFWGCRAGVGQESENRSLLVNQ